MTTLPCPSCGADCPACPDCGGALCAACHQRYEVRAEPRICWSCKAAADQAWLAHGCAGPMRWWPRADPPQLVRPAQLTPEDRVNLWLASGCAGTPGLAYYLEASTTTRPARAGRAYTLRSRGVHLTTVRAHSRDEAIVKANDYLRGIA